MSGPRIALLASEGGLDDHEISRIAEVCVDAPGRPSLDEDLLKP